MGSGRFEFEKCVTGRCRPRCNVAHPALPSATGRLVALVIATYADGNSGIIPEQFSPSLTSLCKATGLVRSTVAAALADLERSGWIVRERPPVALARSQKITTSYRLASPRDGLVRDTDQRTSPGHGPTSPRGGPALVRETDGASPPAGPNQYIQNKPAAARTTSPARGLARDDQAQRVARLLRVDDANAVIDAWAAHRTDLHNPRGLLP